MRACGHNLFSIRLWLAVVPVLVTQIDLEAADRVSQPQNATAPSSIEAVTAATRDSVVVISHFGRDGQEDGVGAGFVISPDGLVATSLHVIGEARPIGVQLADGKRHEVTAIHAWDRNLDLAIIRIDAKKLRPIELGDSDALQQGASVIAIGNPLGLKHSVVKGVLSARREFDELEMLQVAIPIEPGNSGGPLLNMQGQVVGVLTLKSAMTPNLGFAMPGNLVKKLLAKPNPVPMNRWLTIGALDQEQWTPPTGASWRRKIGGLVVNGTGDGFGGRTLCISRKTVPSTPYEVGVSVRLEDEAGAAGLVFASDGADTHYGFYPTGGRLRLTRFEGPNVFTWKILEQEPSPHYRHGEWNHIKVRVEDEKLLCYVNGELLIQSSDSSLTGGSVGLVQFRGTGAEFKSFQVGTNVPPRGLASAVMLPQDLRQRLRQPGISADPELIAALEKEGAAASAALQVRARQLEEEAEDLRELGVSLHRRVVQAEMLKVFSKPEQTIDLSYAALLVARLDDPELEIGPYHEQLSIMANELIKEIPPDADARAKLKSLQHYLFNENGFHGSRTEYYNKANSYLNKVLDYREGLPITLSVLFIDLAQRIGIEGISGIGLPGHFMVKHAPNEGEDLIIDVFNEGKTLTRREAQELILGMTGGNFTDEHYQAATKREIVTRMLRNLLGIALEEDSLSHGLGYLDLILILDPDSIADRLYRGRLRQRIGDTEGAKEDIEWLMDREPPGLDLERLHQFYRSL